MDDPRSARNAYHGRSPFASASKPPILQRFVPLTGSLKGYSSDRLKIDATAGLTVAALALPSGMAYAELAGLPVTAGLYALLLPVLVYAGLGATRRGVIGPEGAVALLVATALAPLAAAGSPEYTALAAALAIAVGLVFVGARLLRLGWIADYFSQSVLVGYISGVAILMALGQLSKLTGVSSDVEGDVKEAFDIVLHIGDANPWTIGVSVVSLVLLVGIQRVAPRLPGALIVVVLGMFASWALDLASHGVDLTGPIPAGLPERVDLTWTRRPCPRSSFRRSPSSWSASPTQYSLHAPSPRSIVKPWTRIRRCWPSVRLASRPASAKACPSARAGQEQRSTTPCVQPARSEAWWRS